MFQDDPSSKIFAPLAEAYRKIGLVDEAIDICREGLILNPDFISGKVALARAYFDKKLFQQVRNVLTSEIEKIPDNLIAQRLLADSCLELGYLQEALNSYKMLLYFSPSDTEVANIVQELESKSYESGGLILHREKPQKVRKLMILQKMLERVQHVNNWQFEPRPSNLREISRSK